ncbi:MAG: phosphate acyltransferase [Coprococcus sp.]
MNASADVLRAALQTLKTAPGTRIVSAFFLVVVPDCEYGAMEHLYSLMQD